MSPDTCGALTSAPFFSASYAIRSRSSTCSMIAMKGTPKIGCKQRKQRPVRIFACVGGNRELYAAKGKAEPHRLAAGGFLPGCLARAENLPIKCLGRHHIGDLELKRSRRASLFPVYQHGVAPFASSVFGPIQYILIHLGHFGLQSGWRFTRQSIAGPLAAGPPWALARRFLLSVDRKDVRAEISRPQRRFCTGAHV